MPVRNGMCDDLWGVRDANGVLHVARVQRFFGSESELIKLIVRTGCSPRPVAWVRANGNHAHYAGRDLPQVVLSNGRLITEWRVVEATTCVACAAAPRSL